jgi:hypothetical protein
VNEVQKITDAHKREIEEAAQDAERTRIIDITSRCDKFNLSAEFKNELIAKKVPVDQAISKILDKVAEGNNVVPPQPIIVKDEADKFRMHAQQSLQVAVGLEKDAKVVADMRKNPGPRDLHGLTRACLIQEGRLTPNQVGNLNAQDLASHAIRMAGSAVGSSDLPAILADTMNKSFTLGMENTPSTFQQWVKETENTDFRAKSMTKLSSFGDIDDMPEGMPFKSGKFSDKKETVTVSTKGKKLSITRQVIVNNDTDAINSIPLLMGAAIKRRQNKDAYDLLAYNSLVGPVMAEDSVALFNAASHSNLKTSSGTVSVTSLGVAEAMLMDMPLQKGSTDQVSSAFSGATAKYLITGTANRIPILQLLGSSTVAFDTAGITAVKPNPYAGNYITPVFDPYLQSLITAGSAGNSWYLAADQMQMGSLVIAYLSGNRTPTLRSEPSGVGDALGIEWDVFYDWGFAFEDYRGIIYNDGK